MTPYPDALDIAVLSPTERARLDTLTYPAPMAMTDADAARAADDLAFVQACRRNLETAREEILSPLRARLDQVRGSFDALLQPIRDAESRVKSVILEWRTYRKTEADRAARETALAAAAVAAAEARIDAQAAGLSSAAAGRVGDQVERVVLAESMQQTAAAPIPRAVAGDVGRATVRTDWIFEVVDVAAVPREYLALDLVLVRRAIREGARTIPGLRIFPRETIAGTRR